MAAELNLLKMMRLWENLENEYEEDTTLSERIKQARAYVDNHLYRAEVVQTLPPDAPGGYLMVKAGDINLYIGAGAGNPLRKIPTQPL